MKNKKVWKREAPRAARQWLEKEPPRSILTWEDLAWDRYKDLLRAFPHHGFTELHQLDTFYNALNSADQDSLNSVADGNPLERRTQDVLTIIENKSKRLAAGGNTFLELRDNIQGYVAAAAVNYNQGNSIYRPPGTDLAKITKKWPKPDKIEYEIVKNAQKPDPKTFSLHINITLADALILISKYQKMLKALLSNKEKLLELANTPLNENCSVVIPKKLPEKLRDPGKFLIPCGFNELKCKALANLANRAICTPAGIARDDFVPVGKFTFPADFVIVDYESDPRVPLILEDLSYGPLESINLINVFNDSNEDFLEDLFSINHQSDNPTFSSHPELTSLEVKDDILDPEGGNVLIEKLLDLYSTKDLHPPLHVNPLSGSTTSSSPPNKLLEEFSDELALITFLLEYDDDLQFDIEFDLKEIEYLLHHDPIKDIDSILKDSIDQSNLVDLNDNLVYSMPEMFTDEHALDYSSPPLYDEYDDDLFEVASETENVYDDPFNSKGEKIEEFKLLVDELDLPCDFLLPSEYDLILSEDYI
nr:hypothetical protein [Tanacetum cinerariifolium]